MDADRHDAGDQDGHAGEPEDVPEAGDDAENAAIWATVCVMLTNGDPVSRCRKVSWRSTLTSAASSGIATAKATTQTLADASSAGTVRKGWTSTRPTAINPP